MNPLITLFGQVRGILMKICVVTGTRAEYGLFYWLLKTLKDDPFFDLQIVVTGMHLSPEFGSTYKEIEKDGFSISDKVESLLSGDSPSAIAKSSALVSLGMADVFCRLKPDLVLLLGDRFEALGAAQAALLSNLPIAHIHGGEATFGAMDDAIRHAITKMSHVHYTTTERYRERVIQLGENPERVATVGSPGVESAIRSALMSQTELEASIDFELSDKFFLVTYHPVTLDVEEQVAGIQAMLDALDAFEDYKVLITFPSADTFGRQIVLKLQNYAKTNPNRVLLIESLGRVRYLSALNLCRCVVGNSSSGVIEAPTFNVPSVDIGTRQSGRVKAESVLNCQPLVGEIRNTINHALSFSKASLDKAGNSIYNNPYYGGYTSEKISALLKKVDLNGIMKKRFFDLPQLSSDYNLQKK